MQKSGSLNMWKSFILKSSLGALLLLAGISHSQVVYKYTISSGAYIVVNGSGSLMWKGSNVSNQWFALNLPKRLLYALENDTVVCRDLDSGELLHKAFLKTPGLKIQCVADSGKLFCFTTTPNQTLYWFSQDLSKLDTLKFKNSEGPLGGSIGLNHAILSPDPDSIYVTTSSYYFFYKYSKDSVINGAPEWEFRAGYHKARFAYLDPDGGVILTSYDQQVFTKVSANGDTVFGPLGQGSRSVAFCKGRDRFVVAEMADENNSKRLRMYNSITGAFVGYSEVQDGFMYCLAPAGDYVYVGHVGGTAGGADGGIRKYSVKEDFSFDLPIWLYTKGGDEYYYAMGDPSGWRHYYFYYKGEEEAKDYSKKKGEVKWVF